MMSHGRSKFLELIYSAVYRAVQLCQTILERICQIRSIESCSKLLRLICSTRAVCLYRSSKLIKKEPIVEPIMENLSFTKEIGDTYRGEYFIKIDEGKTLVAQYLTILLIPFFFT